MKRVVVTGIGMLSPLAANVKDTWELLINSKSGIRKITSFETNDLNVKIAGQNYGTRLYSQIFCMGERQSASYSGGRFMRLINHGGGASGTSRLTVTGGQLIIHGRSGNNSGTDR